MCYMVKKAMVAFAGILFSVLILANMASAADLIGTLTKIDGEVRIKSDARGKGNKWLIVKRAGTRLYNGDEIRTLAGKAEVTFTDKSVMKVRANSKMKLEEKPTTRRLFGFIKKSFINRNIKVYFGSAWAKIRSVKGKWTSFESRSAVAGIRGTTISFDVDENGNMKFACDEGIVDMTETGSGIMLTLESGKKVIFKKGKGADDGKINIEALEGDIDIVAKDGTKISMTEDGVVDIKIEDGETSVENKGGVGQGDAVTVTTDGVTATLDSGEGIEMTTTSDGKTEFQTLDGNDVVELQIGDTEIVIDKKDTVSLDVKNAVTGEAELTVVEGTVEATTVNEDNTTDNITLEKDDVVEIDVDTTLINEQIDYVDEATAEASAFE